MKRPQIKRRARGERKPGAGEAAGQAAFVKMRPLMDDSNLVMLVEPQVEGLNLPMWLRENVKNRQRAGAQARCTAVSRLWYEIRRRRDHP